MHPLSAATMTPGPALLGTRASLEACWLKLALADLLFKLFAFVLLSPLLSLSLRVMLYLGGQRVLSDVDIAYFFVRPVGWVSLVLIGGLWLALLALEQAVLLAILAAASKGKRLGVVSALRFALRSTPAIFWVSLRIILLGILVLTPFLATAGVVYFQLLRAHDINYYLTYQPREFQISAAIGAVLLGVLALIGIRLAASWFMALPLVLFDRTASRAALNESGKLMRGRRLRVCAWILLWLLGGLAVQSAMTFVVGLVGKWLLLSQSQSLVLLAEKVGLIVIAIFLFSVAINVAYTSGFAILLFRAYCKWNPQAAKSIEQAGLSGAKSFDWQRAMTRSRLATAMFVGSIFAALTGYLTLGAIRIEDHAKVMAHRGASKVAPENSKAAVLAAIEAGADWVEIDVQETADGKVVVIHDSDFMKLAKNPLKIWNATAKDLETIDIGSSFDPRFASERTPTLDDVLAKCKGKIGVMIELKYYGRDQKLEERVAELVDKHGMANQVMVMSLKPEGVRKMKALRPTWKCGVLMSVAIGNLHKMEADFFAVNSRFATRDFIRRAHNMKRPVYAWTIDDPAAMSMLMNRGVDGIITNRPEIARQVLLQRADMSLAQRWLTEIGAIILNAPEGEEQ